MHLVYSVCAAFDFNMLEPKQLWRSFAKLWLTLKWIKNLSQKIAHNINKTGEKTCENYLEILWMGQHFKRTNQQPPHRIADFMNTHLLCNASIFFSSLLWMFSIQLFTDEMALQLLLHRPDLSTFCGNLRVSNHVTLAIVLD